MAQTFRPYPEEGADIMGHFRPTHFLYDTITNGGFHFMPLVGHILIPIYGIYRLMKQSGYWTPRVDYAVEALLIPLVQGLAVGGIFGTLFLRYATAEGRRIASKRAEDSATDREDRDQHRLEVLLWAFIYLGFATVLWQQFPATDGPGITAFKRLAGKVGVDLGGIWETRKY